MGRTAYVSYQKIMQEPPEVVGAFLEELGEFPDEQTKPVGSAIREILHGNPEVLTDKQFNLLKRMWFAIETEADEVLDNGIRTDMGGMFAPLRTKSLATVSRDFMDEYRGSDKERVKRLLQKDKHQILGGIPGLTRRQAKLLHKVWGAIEQDQYSAWEATEQRQHSGQSGRATSTYPAIGVFGTLLAAACTRKETLG